MRNPTSIPVDTRRRFNVHKTSATSYRRLMDVKTMPCVYWEHADLDKYLQSSEIFLLSPENKI